jgi:hypothetical protein
VAGGQKNSAAPRKELEVAFEEVDLSLAPFIGWGSKPKQHVTGYVVDYDEEGGRDYDKEPCPRVEVELTEVAASFDKEGKRTNHEAGTTVALTCGLPNLKYGIQTVARKYGPLQGKLVKIVLTQLVATDKGNDRKEFKIFVDQANSRSGGGSSNGATSSAADDDFGGGGNDDDEPPF